MQREKRRWRTEREAVHLEYPPSAALPPPLSPKAEAEENEPLGKESHRGTKEAK